MGGEVSSSDAKHRSRHKYLRACGCFRGIRCVRAGSTAGSQERFLAEVIIRARNRPAKPQGSPLDRLGQGGGKKGGAMMTEDRDLSLAEAAAVPTSCAMLGGNYDLSG